MANAPANFSLGTDKVQSVFSGGFVSGSFSSLTRNSAIQLTNVVSLPVFSVETGEIGYAMNFWFAWPDHTMLAPVK